MSALRQIATVTGMGLRGIPQRIGTSLVIVIGIAGVVGVTISLLAMATGISATMSKGGRADRVMVLRSGASEPLVSSVTRENALTIMDAPGVKHDADGKPVAAGIAMALVELPANHGGAANVPMLGVTANFFQLKSEIHITDGRTFSPGLREVVVGKAVQAQFMGMAVGRSISFRDNDWTIVGSFEAEGDSVESEIIGDAETVMAAYRRTTYQEVMALLESADAYAAFRDAITTNPSLQVSVNRESEYLVDKNKQLNTVLRAVGFGIGGIMAVGALFGALNTMYSAVSARTREIATLRALGFGGGAVVVSVLVEALLLALGGGALGALFTRVFLNGSSFSSSFGGLSQVGSALLVTPGLMIGGVALALVLGLLGGLFPAIRAARMTVAAALKVK